MNTKHALVTGGLQGIGKAIVDQLQQRGDQVTVFDVADPSDERVTALQQNGITYHQVDVSNIASIQDAFSKINSIDILVNNAGITKDNLAIRMRESDWDSVLNVNLKGAFFVAQCALKKMIKNPQPENAHARGYIINISSVVAAFGNPGQVNYVASKAGLTSVTKTLAREYGARNIVVNAIAPGFIQTRMTDKLSDSVKDMARERIALKRFGTPDDVAHLVAFLTSGKGDYITGHVIDVTGGM